MRKILLPWGGEMGIISLRCRVSAAPGGSVACCRRWGAGNTLPLPYYSVFIVIIPLVDRPCNPHRAIARGGKMVYRTGSYSSCIQNPCPLFRRICGRAGDTPPFPVRCAFSRWNSVHADLGFPPRGRRIPATAGFYGVRVLGLTPRRAGGRCPPRPRWSARSGRSGPSCPSGGSIPLAAPSPCRDGVGR